MALELEKSYIFDSCKFVFVAFASSDDVLRFDSGWISDIDWNLSPEVQYYTNPSIATYDEDTSLGLFSCVNAFDFITGYQDIPTALEGYRCNLLLIVNQNYHAPVYDEDLEFLGYETGSLDFSSFQVSFPDDWPTAAECFMKGNAPDSTLGYFGNGWNRSFTGNGVTSELVTKSSVTRGFVTYPAGPAKFASEPLNQYLLQVDVTPEPVNVNQIYFYFKFLIPRSVFTVNVRSTPYDQTSVKKIYFRDSANAIVFYEYMGQDYTQSLRHGEGIMWHGLGSGYIRKAIIHDHFAWVYIDGQKYLCKSLGQDLSVY